jgi:hypothetical protein
MICFNLQMSRRTKKISFPSLSLVILPGIYIKPYVMFMAMLSANYCIIQIYVHASHLPTRRHLQH